MVRGSVKTHTAVMTGPFCLQEENMFTDDEKDYLMRIIKEVARVLPVESKYQISGDKLHHLKTMVDNGEINEAENELLDRIDYSDKEDLAEAMFFYEYAASKGDEFLEAHNYSLEEVKDGLQQLAQDAGYGNIMNMLDIG